MGEDASFIRWPLFIFVIDQWFQRRIPRVEIYGAITRRVIKATYNPCHRPPALCVKPTTVYIITLDFR